MFIVDFNWLLILWLPLHVLPWVAMVTYLLTGQVVVKTVSKHPQLTNEPHYTIRSNICEIGP